MMLTPMRDHMLQERNNAAAGWISPLPGGAAEGDAWLSYWRGVCLFPTDMSRARNHLEKAFASFTAGGDAAGLYLSWAAIVDTYAFELDGWKRLDGCIASFDGLRKTHPLFPSRDVELIASSRMLIALTLRQTDRPQRVHGWLARVNALLQDKPSFEIQMDTVFCMSLYHLWKGEYHQNEILLERAEAEMANHPAPPFTVIRIRLMKGIHCWITARYGQAVSLLAEGIASAGRSGVHVFDSLLWSFRAAAELAPGNIAAAEQALKNQMRSSVETARALDIYFCHINAAWCALLKGNTDLAAKNLETIAARVARLGTPYYQALWNIGMAHVAFQQGHRRAAGTHARRALRLGQEMKSTVVEWYALTTRAYVLLHEGKEKEGLAALSRGLALARRYNYVHLEFYQPKVTRYLCARALAEGIEPEYVRGLIRTLKLSPPAEEDAGGIGTPAAGFRGAASVPERWPFPLRIFTTGRFEIIRDGRPLVFSGKVQKKPLELLKALIALGGANVPEERLIDTLWPDADGDLAHKSFEMTLSRLRRLLGGEGFITHSAGQLSIDPLSCRVDSLVLERILADSGKRPAASAGGLCEQAAGLYRGDFLPADSSLPGVASRRETLKNSLLRALLAAGREYERTGRWERAGECYLQGLAADELAEEFYQRLMICHRQSGNRAGAVRTYNRCRALLRERLGIEPSSQTKAIHSALLQQQ